MPRWRASSRSGAIRNTEGSELITNGNMELDANWSNIGTPVDNSRSNTQAHAGTYSRKAVTDAAGEGIQGDAFSTDTGGLYKIIMWAYSGASANQPSLHMQKGDNSGLLLDIDYSLTTNTWARKSVSILETAGGAGAFIQLINPNGYTIYYDDVSVKKLTPSLG